MRAGAQIARDIFFPMKQVMAKGRIMIKSVTLKAKKGFLGGATILTKLFVNKRKQ